MYPYGNYALFATKKGGRVQPAALVCWQSGRIPITVFADYPLQQVLNRCEDVGDALHLTLTFREVT